MAGVVHAVDDDDVLGPAGERQHTGPNTAKIARVEPTVGSECFRGTFWVGIVSARNRRPADLHPPDLPLGHNRAVHIGHPQPSARYRPAKISEFIGVSGGFYRKVLGEDHSR
ncbi:Uncharacterised protein [Mycobacteroides abscessus subsp. abscessus]|nr:Uncharacterised protein [Mycobacteroides abscessus subsp. abscessus]